MRGRARYPSQLLRKERIMLLASAKPKSASQEYWLNTLVSSAAWRNSIKRLGGPGLPTRAFEPVADDCAVDDWDAPSHQRRSLPATAFFLNFLRYPEQQLL